jgi:hypothetical protein
VIAATSNDLANLAVALLVREGNPHQRVVLLLTDPQFAAMLRQGANVRLAVSVPALAAPAFVAALFGDRVPSVFLVYEKLFAAIDVLVQPADPLADQTVRAVAVDYRLLPVAVLPAQGPAPDRPLAARLTAGDRLVAIISLPDLERLLRRQPPPGTYAVDVSACPLPTRGWLAGLLRTVQGLSQEDAEKALDRMPVRLGEKLTRGQAEDLLARLVKERVTARVCPMM